MDLQINRSFEAFEVYTKEHYLEMLCTAEKAHNLSFLKKLNQDARRVNRRAHVRQVAAPEVRLEECPISLNFWVNPV